MKKILKAVLTTKCYDTTGSYLLDNIGEIKEELSSDWNSLIKCS